ncbi:MAG: nuclear transport factor 2 family protein [Ignavibacteriaceae bacterium]
MKRFSFIYAISIVLLFSVLSLAKIPPQTEEIEKTITGYVSGIDSRDVSSLEKTLASNARFVTINKFTDKMISLTREEFMEQIKAGKMGGWKRNLEVVSVDGDDKIASAKVSITDPKLKQTGYLNLVKDENNWKIVSGVFTLESNNK